MDNKPDKGLGMELGASPAPLDESAGRVKDAASDIGRELKTAAHDIADAAKNATADKVEELQHAAVDQTRSAANVLRQTAGGLNGDLPWMKQAFEKAADGLEHLTQSIDKGDLNQTLDRVGDFARKQPALFLGLSVAAGFALARVGKTAVEVGTEAVAGADRSSPRAVETPGLVGGQG